LIRAFLSHTSIDKDLVKNVHKNLLAENAWFDAANIENGERIPEKINEGLRQATHFVLFWSESASRAPWVLAELNAALVQMIAGKCKFMIFSLDDTKLPELLQPYKYDRIDKSNLVDAARTIADKIMAQEGVPSKLTEFVNRTSEIGDIEESVRAGYKLIILNGILGIGKSSLAERAIQWFYPNRATNRLILDFNFIPGIAELSIELARQTRKSLKNTNLSTEEQKQNIQYFLECISASNSILILKDVKKWLDEDGTPTENLLFITDMIVSTQIFGCATIMTSSRYIEIPTHYYEQTRQITIRGMENSHISEIISNNLPKSFLSDTHKNLCFAKRLYGYPLGAKLAAYRISNHGYDYYLEQPEKIQSLKVGLAKQLISYADLSAECINYLKIVALSQSRLRNEEYAEAFPMISHAVAKLADEAFFAGILKFNDDCCYQLEPLVEDHFYNMAFSDPNRKSMSNTLEIYLLDIVKAQTGDKYMRLVPAAVHILTLNGKVGEAIKLRAELTATITSSMWDQYNHMEYEEAKDTADGLLAMDEQNVEALYVKSLCLTRFDEYDRAVAILNTLLKGNPENSARYYYALGRIQKRKGNYFQAVELFQIAVKKRRKYLSPYREMAECYMLKDQVDAAQGAIERAKQIDDSNIFVILLEARLLQKENRAGAAIELLSRQSIMEQDSDQISFRKGRAYDQLGRKEEAKECYEAAIRYNSKAYDAKLCLLNHQIVDDPQTATKVIDTLKLQLKGKRRFILTNIEARFVGYYNHDEAKAMEMLDGVPSHFRDKQWCAVRVQLLENLITCHSNAGRNLLAEEYRKDLENVQHTLEEKYGEKGIVEADLLPDA